MEPEEHVLDLLPAYALDALDEEDLVTVSSHLTRCSLCQAELRSFQTVVDELALVVPVRTPSPDVKQRLLDAVDGSRTVTGAERNSRKGLSLSFLRPLAILGLTTLLFLALLLGSLLVRQGQQGQQVQQVGGLQVVALNPTEAAPRATGMIVMSESGEYGTLVVTGLPQLDEERQYQLWMVYEETRDNAGVFSVEEDGYGVLYLRAPRRLSDYSRFGITIEPAGGSPGPTGEGVLRGTP
jgi:anti-sigma-K factor RskA